MIRCYFIFLLLWLGLNSYGQDKTVDLPYRQLTKEQWQEDFHALYDSLRTNHLNLYHFTPKTVFDQKYHAIFNEIPKLSNEQILLRYKQFVSLAGDGHTMLSDPGDFHRYPLDFFIFGKQVILIQSEAKYKQALGLQLLSINNFPITQIRDSLNSIIDHGESKTYLLKQQTDRLGVYEYLSAFGFISNRDSAVFEFQDGKKTIELKVAAIPAHQSVDWQWAFRPLPLFLENGMESSTPIAHKSIRSDTYYINFAGYPSWEDFEKITTTIYDSLNHQKARKIIIDMRLNGGGNFDKGLKLMLPLFLNYNALHPGTSYYVLIGRRTFSAGMSNAVHFKDCLNAILVGEPTGARPNGYQEIKWFKLPYSKLEVSCSLLFYSFQQKNTDGVLPDKTIMPLFKAYSEGRDPALDWILKRTSTQEVSKGRR